MTHTEVFNILSANARRCIASDLAAAPGFLSIFVRAMLSVGIHSTRVRVLQSVLTLQWSGDGVLCRRGPTESWVRLLPGELLLSLFRRPGSPGLSARNLAGHSGHIARLRAMAC